MNFNWVNLCRPGASVLLFIFLSSGLQCKNEVLESDYSVSLSGVEISQMRVPLFTGKTNDKIVNIRFEIPEGKKEIILEGISILFTEGSQLDGISSVVAYYSGNSNSVIYGASFPLGGKVNFKSNQSLIGLTHDLNFNFTIKPDADLLTCFGIKSIELFFNNQSPVKVTPTGNYTHRMALLLRSPGQDNCDTYRIPGLITTEKGTLIAVYDNRYNSSKDLQEDIDIGMSRSTDGGQTWERMKVIMDMGEYGGRPQQQNGTGDPCILYDSKNNVIWVAALWMSGAGGQALWWASGPGMKPEETGQFILVKSTDDGITWSQPINITEQIKDPSWQLLLQGPGRGITLKEGTLVFPAQFKADIGTKAIDGGQFTCHSTIVYSKDSGKT